MHSIDNKVNVTKLFLGGGACGNISPAIDMPVKMNQGETFYIAEIFTSGTFLLGLALSPGGGIASQVKRVYAHDVYVDYATATGVPYLYPSGSYNSVQYTHKGGNFLSGFDVAVNSGTTVENPNGNPTSFGR